MSFTITFSHFKRLVFIQTFFHLRKLKFPLYYIISSFIILYYLYYQILQLLIQSQQYYYNKKKHKINIISIYIKNNLTHQNKIQQITTKIMMEQKNDVNDGNKNVNEFNKFLQNNKDFLQQKYVQHFGEQSFLLTELQTKLKIELGIKFIYDVFSFQKYQKDQKMNATLKKSLKENIISFIKNQSNGNTIKQIKKFGSEQGIKLLKYCIENNQMFAVHYDKKDKIKQENTKNGILQKKQISQESQNKNQKEQKKEILQKQNQEQYKNQEMQEKIIQNLEKLNFKQLQRPFTEKIEKKQQKDKQNYTEKEYRNEQTLKKQAKIIFDFYCKQQMNAGGPNATFDKIYHETGAMTLGKFLAFANISRVLFITRVQAYKPKDQKVLDKKTINQVWRKISKGQKQINFDRFFELINELNKIDETVFEKLNMGKDENTNKILRKLKYLNTPFNMKSQFAKDLQLDHKPFIPKTTGHSGKFTHSIQQDMVERKQKLRYLPFQHNPNPNQIKMTEESYLNSSVLRSIKHESGLSESKVGLNHFISQLGNPEKKSKTTHQQPHKIRLENSRIQIQGTNKFYENDQIIRDLIVFDEQNDDQFLKDYKIPQLTSQAILRKKQLANINNLKAMAQLTERSDRLNGVKTRKNVVDSLKQRIRQVQKSQTKQSISRQKRRSIQSVYNRN